MRGGAARLAMALALTPLASGCVAAVAPVLASGALVRGRLATARAAQPQAATAPEPQRRAPIAAAVPVGPAPVAASRTLPDTMRYLYGSGEAAALSVQAFQALAAYVTGPVAYTIPSKLKQAVLAEGSTLDKPFFEQCGGKKQAVVLDVDETVLLNLGFEADAARSGNGYDASRWARWEATGADKVVAVPGAKAALDAIRKAGVTVIFNTNRSNADATQRALEGAGLGPAKHQETLFLKGDDGGTGSGKDVRRWAIASGYCVVAMAGDQLGDFTDLFNDAALTPARRRAAATSAPFAQMWGKGWFLLPNPVYGTGVAGTFDDVFPADTWWTDPGATPPTP